MTTSVTDYCAILGLDFNKIFTQIRKMEILYTILESFCSFLNRPRKIAACLVAKSQDTISSDVTLFLLSFSVFPDQSEKVLTDGGVRKPEYTSNNLRQEEQNQGLLSLMAQE